VRLQAHHTRVYAHGVNPTVSIPFNRVIGVTTSFKGVGGITRATLAAPARIAIVVRGVGVLTSLKVRPA
jgi:hypothetical protein